MKNYILLLLLFFVSNIYAQEQKSGHSIIEKDENGIRIDAPKGVHQYAFRIGEWETAYKSLVSRYEWKAGTGKYRVYVAKNGLTFVEEAFNKDGEIESRITYDYDEATNSWDNNYLEVKTGKKVKYTSKFVDGKMVETIEREDHVNNNTYTVVAENVVLYTAVRTYHNGFNLVTHVGIATKKVPE